MLLDYGLEGYGLYWYCLELIASKVDKDKVTFELEHDARVIARNSGSTPQKVEEMMRYFVSVGLFENAEGVISCLKMAKRLDKSMTSNNEMRKIIEGLAMNTTQLDGYVYFIEKRDSYGKAVAIKIGRSKNPTSRLAEISKLDENIGYKLDVICKVKSENCVSLETELHRKFKDFRIYNEWFKPDVAIYDLIESDYVMITTAYDMQEEKRIEENREEILASQGEATKKPSVTCEEVVSVYHEILPEAKAVRILSDKRRNMIRSFWKNASKITRQMDGRAFTIDDWRSYLDYISANCRWMLENRADNKTGKTWQVKGIEYFLNAETYVQVREGNKDDR